MCNEKTLTIGISQSGETKDTLEALEEAKRQGSHISSFCNVIGSTMARLTSNGTYLHAGPEFAVASTKTFTNMLSVFSLFAISISDRDDSYLRDIVSELRMLPSKIKMQLNSDIGSIDGGATSSQANTAILIGKGISSHLPGTPSNWSRSYIPCVAHPGELKRSIALIEEGTPVIAIARVTHLRETWSQALGVQSRVQ